jgi:hypothetical protein
MPRRSSSTPSSFAGARGSRTPTRHVGARDDVAAAVEQRARRAAALEHARPGLEDVELRDAAQVDAHAPAPQERRARALVEHQVLPVHERQLARDLAGGGHARVVRAEAPAAQRGDRDVEGAAGARRDRARHREHLHQLRGHRDRAHARGVVDPAHRARRIVVVHHVGEALHLAVGGVDRAAQPGLLRALGDDLHRGAHERARLLHARGVRGARERAEEGA